MRRYKVTTSNGDIFEVNADSIIAAIAPYRDAGFNIISAVEDKSDRVTVRCQYFKDSGKWYTDGEVSLPRSFFEGCIYPTEFGRRLRAEKSMPGLNSGYWSSYFTIEVEGAYTELVLPDGHKAQNPPILDGSKADR